MVNARPPRGRPSPRATVPLRDRSQDERERTYFTPRAGDWLLLGLLVVVLLGNGLVMWHQLGPANDHTGRAIFFGLALLCALWFAVVYTFKLSVCVRVGPHGIAVVRGPWQTELAWSQVARLVERGQLAGGQRFRWVVAFARDGRSLQVREDMVLDYARFRQDVWEHYRLWRDHGGTWGTTGGGPFGAREDVSAETRWWLVAGCAALLPGLYFAFILPAVSLVGPLLLAFTAVCAVMGLRSRLRQQTYTVDGKLITAKRLVGTARLAWRDVARVERTRHKFSALLQAGIAVGQFALRLAARSDSRVQSFDWYPRVPEYLTLRGAGRHIRIRLHRLARPDEMLAWVEFYERQAHHRATSGPAHQTAAPAARTGRVTGALAPLAAGGDTITPGAPVDPWAAGYEGAPFAAAPPGADMPGDTLTAATSAGSMGSMPAQGPDSSAAWLSAEPGDAWQPGAPPQRAAGSTTWQSQEVDGTSRMDPFTPFTPLPPLTRAGPSSDDASVRDPANGDATTPRQAHEPTLPSVAPWSDQTWGAAAPGAGAGGQPALDRPAAYDTWEPPQVAASTQGALPGGWSENEVAPAPGPRVEAPQPAPVESLAELFAPWRKSPPPQRQESSAPQRPVLPRYGPPIKGDGDGDRGAGDLHSSPDQKGDADEFLR